MTGTANFSASSTGGSAFAQAQGGLTTSILGNANGIVAYAQQRVLTVDNFVSNLSNQVLTLVAPSITPQFPTPSAAPALNTSGAPSVAVPVWAAPGMPDAFTQVLDVSSLGVEPFDATPPTITYGAAPAPSYGALPQTPAIDLAFDYPGLNVTLPAAPTLLGINTINFSGVNMPTLTAQPPDTILLVAPQITQYTPGEQYTSALLTQLQATLQATLAQGSDGLTMTGEQAIWDRGRDREAISQRDALLKLDQMEALGYAFPPGIWLDARTRIITETTANERGYNREAAAKSAELALDFVKHSLSMAVEIESKLIDYNNSVEQRVFESCKYVTEAGVSIYNAKVQAYSAMVEAYKSKIQAYNAEVQGQLALVEVYKAQIEAEHVKAETNTALVEQYKAMIEAAMTSVEVYKAELQGIQIKADIERTKVQMFGELVQAYAAQVNAYTAQIEGYKATLQAEQTKEQIYATQVQAYSTQVDAAVKLIESNVAVYKAQIDAKQLQYDGYKTAVQAESARVDALVRGQGLAVDVYRASVAADQSYNEVLTKQWQVALDQAERVAEIGINAAKANGDLYISSRGLALEAAKASATVSAQIAAAGINAVNYSGSVSSSESTNVSASVSGSGSNSTSSSESRSYNYNYSV